MQQKFCVFEPIDGPPKGSNEGGAYGTCTCYPNFPKSTDLMAYSNLNYACLAWTKKNPGFTPPVMPGTKCKPYPLVCPNTLKNCYADKYFQQGGPVSGN